MKAVILAGGKGTRMGNVCKAIPKPMVSIGGKPILQHQIELLRRYNITDIIIVTHYLSNVIEDYFSDGKKFNVNISYFKEKKPLGTAGSFAELSDQLSEDFLVLYGDVMMSMNLHRLIGFHKERKALCSLVLHPNDHPYDSDLVEIDDKDRVISFHSKPHNPDKYYRNLVNAAAYVMSPSIIKYIKKDVTSDFGKDIFPSLVVSKNMYGYVTTEYLKDAGTPERFEKVTQDFLSGKVELFNREYKQKAIFLDRDGVINKEVNLLHAIDDFELLPGAIEAIKKINDSGYLVIVVTNQPVVARNLCSLDDLNKIHNKMETLLGNSGAKIDKTYFCPHHPDQGYQGENKEYKIVCSCRKPKPGMVYQAAKDFNIDRSKSFLIGDSDRDMLCAREAGLTSIKVKSNHQEFTSTVAADFSFCNLYDAVCFILN